MDKKLSPKQKAFADYYIETGNEQKRQEGQGIRSLMYKEAKT